MRTKTIKPHNPVGVIKVDDKILVETLKQSNEKLWNDLQAAQHKIAELEQQIKYHEAASQSYQSSLVAIAEQANRSKLPVLSKGSLIAIVYKACCQMMYELSGKTFLDFDILSQSAKDQWKVNLDIIIDNPSDTYEQIFQKMKLIKFMNIDDPMELNVVHRLLDRFQFDCIKALIHLLME